ncbi:DUF2768 family protein [Microbulbifer epialgicus]|uniref:DUF2768 family protein n=1 Tax=Microbulbifer epialgicus TaxID=393907 RepID=A0ABV4NY94_9GAMM
MGFQGQRKKIISLVCFIVSGVILFVVVFSWSGSIAL